MGIPAFYRWLVDRYPLAVVNVLQEVPVSVNGVLVPIDTSGPNPNNVEFDNLYLDMNGIIHPCFHPEGQPAPKTYEEVFMAVFKYIDHIFSLIRPRKLLYMAIDGVAPRAKMNQQRARRFRAAKDAEDEAAGAERLRIVLQSEGESLPLLEQTKTLDSNVITPGTKFMASLSSALQYYVQLRMNSDPGWRGIKVILSDANVPGEGEHKIMSYIRSQRNRPGFDPNTRHCLYGLDADLIMLALATHELHFSILREDVRKAHGFDKKSKLGKVDPPVTLQGKVEIEDVNDISRQRFQFINIWVLRDYLVHDLRITDPTVRADLERLVDDFVFMCLFVGNDFLPHIPSLEISEGAIDLLITVYKKEFVQMGGYLTNSFEVNLKNVEHFIQVVASHENAIFRRRIQIQKEREIRSRNFSNKNISRSNESSVPREQKRRYSDDKEILSAINGGPGSTNAQVDKVKLGEEGWKERFYTEKFEANTEDDREKIQRHAAICKLPFIEEPRLLSEIAKVEPTLTDEEKQRNSLGLDLLFVHVSHPLAVKIFSFQNRMKDHPKMLEAKVKRKIDPKYSGKMNGYVYISDKPVSQLEIYSPIQDMEMITKNKIISVFYKCPPFNHYIPRPPGGVTVPEKTVKKRDILPAPVLWHEKSSVLGRIFSERPVPNSISGPHLSQSAHLLISTYYRNNRKETKGSNKAQNVKEINEAEENINGLNSRKRERSDGCAAEVNTCLPKSKDTTCEEDISGSEPKRRRKQRSGAYRRSMKIKKLRGFIS